MNMSNKTTGFLAQLCKENNLKMENGKGNILADKINSEKYYLLNEGI